MATVAQTNIQLYNQLRQDGRDLQEIRLVHQAYELAAQLYSGYYQADGKPFVAHCVGVASVLANLGRPAEVVAAALLHNVYTNGDFGDGRHHVATPLRRRLLREASGEAVEALVYRFFHDLRVVSRTFDAVYPRLEAGDEGSHDLALIDLADCLEKYVDLGVLYFGDGDWVKLDVATSGASRIEMAQRLGYPSLAEALSAAFAAAATSELEVSAALQPSDSRRYLRLTVPRSCHRRLSTILLGRAFDSIWQLRIRLSRLLGRSDAAARGSQDA